MIAIISTYGAEGWIDREININSERLCRYALAHDMRIDTDADAIGTIEAMLKIGQPGGPWRGKQVISAVVR